MFFFDMEVGGRGLSDCFFDTCRHFWICFIQEARSQSSTTIIIIIIVIVTYDNDNHPPPTPPPHHHHHHHHPPPHPSESIRIHQNPSDSIRIHQKPSSIIQHPSSIIHHHHPLQSGCTHEGNCYRSKFSFGRRPWHQSVAWI